MKSRGEKSIQVGLSACLAGHEVRYNGGHTQSRLCLNVLSKHFEFKTFCPEVAAGFGTPRPTMRLTGNPESPQLNFSDDNSKDLTDQLVSGFEHKLPEMGSLDGYILMRNSPSCGMERVKVYQPNGHAHMKPGMGVFARALREKYPLMPIEEEGRLNDDVLYDNFVMRVYAYHNFRKEVLDQPSVLKLTKFHASYKYLLMAHNQKQAKALGRLLAGDKSLSIEMLAGRYFEGFMQTLSKPANRRGHTNALLHILGYLKRSVPSVSRQHIESSILKYKEGITPLATPLTLLSHYLSQFGSAYINEQRYLQPYPENIHPIRKYCH
ncbi:hypothetical protein A3749_02615 [Oleiphilus sp. HI0078]|nr:hypothetical protein A3729_07530 [Oleiphilus sp. HI0043]KZY44767.1 hypothetical protein A3732_11745 [Oleiphilus sp. HI0050]KZY60690.1 hypothetical protein A3735_00220 [Oleiphilus sp. HI0061]KZY75414.1 hypothetical protein A3741_12280 [Oleiphilus sp. HI0069]KZY77914.1 hypothetical protein A3740_09435 [Oleiphilus sp. HI0068]KZY87869.1 hypothetical protein A3743_13330 [Oleiphilus sp. HI0072]KZZ21749.1 hypothetical protein A3749_02615 [Oleiphilus sp. HI0078]KZZ38491.1 hypothetical protein A37